jgi:2-dehydro-3-deoxygalactonokinase
MPFKTDGSDLKMEYVKASAEFEHDVFVISGVCSHNDVMRGEETQLVGAVDVQSEVAGVYIFPGTHSKHIDVKDGIAYEFRTYMTGEIFSLLLKNSTLSESIGDTPPGALGPIDDDFIAGVKDSIGSNLLHKLFRVRSRFLLDKKEPWHNREYLSGLLIGNELQELSRRTTEKIVIISSAMGDHYKAAIQVFDNSIPISIVDDRDVAIRGQFRIVSRTA